MAIDVDSAIGLQQQALLTRSRRAEVLASNLANVDTPGFKARDIDFAASLREADRGLEVRGSHVGHITTARAPGGELLYRYPHQPARDGNTVEAYVEKSEFMKNSLRYSAGLTFIGARFNGWISALRGGN